MYNYNRLIKYCLLRLVKYRDISKIYYINGNEVLPWNYSKPLKADDFCIRRVISFFISIKYIEYILISSVYS